MLIFNKIVGPNTSTLFTLLLYPDQEKAQIRRKHDERHGRDKAERTKASAEQVRREVKLLYKQADQMPLEVLSNLSPVVHQHEQQLKQQQQKEKQQQQQQQHS
jgi:phage-related protein